MDLRDLPGVDGDVAGDPRSPFPARDPVRRAALAPGEVALVGTGPGDPELLTVRAVRLLGDADVVLHDHLVSPEIMALAPPAAERIYVGKERNLHAMRQEAINALMVGEARAGRRVVRLKGGDPFVFGRGGEEIETLARHGVPFQVVPGITAALGAGAYAGIPLTHRDYAQAVVFVTAHRKDGSADLDWPALARPRQTVVFYMGSLALPEICRRLPEHGLPASTPAAVIQQATTAGQRVLSATLATLEALAAQSELAPPTLIIVGEVVRLREQLGWFEPRPPASPSLPQASPRQARAQRPTPVPAPV